jgi:hypothetical protein
VLATILAVCLSAAGKDSAPKKVLAKYEYIFSEGTQIFHGYIVKTAPKQWQERTDKADIPVYYFREIPGEEGWITLYDSSRAQYARFRPGEDGPFQQTSDPKGKWGAPLNLTAVIVEPPPTPKPSPTTKPTPVPPPTASPTPKPTPEDHKVDPGAWTADKQIATAFGIAGVVVMLIIAIFYPNPAPFQYMVFRVVLALVGAGMGATIPGLLDVNVHGAIRATGAIAVFVIVFFFPPARLVSHKPN